jgi:hypothetical protein
VAKRKTTPVPPPNRNRWYVAAGAAVLVLAVAGLFLSRGDSQTVREPLTTTFSPIDLQRARGVSMGQENAPVLLHEFADYQCPACANFSTFAHPLIKERLIDEGIVRLVRYDFPLQFHPHAFLASRAARCTEETGRYWEYHDILYGRQPTWSAQRDPSGEFIEYAELIGMDPGEFRTCLRSAEHAEEVTRNLRLGESLGVSGTPTLMLNGEILEIRDYNDLEVRVLEAAGRTPAATPGAATEPAADSAAAAAPTG